MSVAWVVGQEVILRERMYTGVRIEPATISRVGRKYVYVQKGWRERTFYADSGAEKANGSYGGQIFTPDSLAAYERDAAERARFDRLTQGYSWASQLTTDQRERIANILEESAS